MKKHPLAWILAFFIGGIVLFSYGTQISWLIILCFSLLLLFILHAFRLSKFGFWCALMAFFLAAGALRMHHTQLWKKDIETHDDYYGSFLVQISQEIKPSEKYHKYEAQIIQVFPDSLESLQNQKILLYVIKDQPKLLNTYSTIIHGRLSRIPSAKNPYTFDYQRYMDLRGVGLQHFTDTLTQVNAPTRGSPALAFSKYKNHIKDKMHELEYSESARIFISALVLGDRNDMNRDWQDRLSSAGIMHLFAISGLHIGILFALFMLILYPLLYLPRGRWIRIFIALLFIWCFAWFVGFSPSVSRAALMISLYYSALALQRPQPLFHTLALAGIVNLFWYPNDLYHVGFQLSYAAVFFIVWLREFMLQIIPKFPRKIKYLRDIMAVTISAQFGVTPISIFYFQKFTGLFLLGNMLLLPFASILLAICFITVVLLSLDIHIPYYTIAINGLFEFINTLITFLAEQDRFIFRNIIWNPLQVLLVTIFLLYIPHVFKPFRWNKMFIPLSLIIALLVNQISVDYINTRHQELIIFHVYKGTAVGVREGSDMHIIWQVEDSAKTMDFVIQPYLSHQKIRHTTYHSLYDTVRLPRLLYHQGYLKTPETSLLISSRKDMDIVAADYVLLHAYREDSAHLHANTRNLIIDGSNYPSTVQRLKQQFPTLHSTAEQGAARLSTIHSSAPVVAYTP
ncbi:MAG: ComEC/Rec2 family competence protein [Weeksellaceae bacterium]|nr:ComEC/Rec2 family competence protein [Weeksellaceae bacterium]